MLDDDKDLGIPDRTLVPKGLQYELLGVKPCNLLSQKKEADSSSRMLTQKLLLYLAVASARWYAVLEPPPPTLLRPEMRRKEEDDVLCTPSCLAGWGRARWPARRRGHCRRRRTGLALRGIPAAATAGPVAGFERADGEARGWGGAL